MNVTTVPMPGECHPAYTEHRAWITNWLCGNDMSPRFVIEPEPFPAYRDDGALGALPKHVLTRQRRVAAPAPWTYVRYRYVWEVAVDELGRAVAGESTLWSDPYDVIQYSDPLVLPEWKP